MSIPLTVIEDIVSRSGVTGAIEQMLGPAVRGRQLKAGTLLAGMLLALADGRPAHLTRAHAALTSLPEPDRNGWASSRTGTTARTSSPADRSSTLTG